jgi:hypothetical protein
MTYRVCLVTVHGIGFQQPPEDGRSGYADGLHSLLEGKSNGVRLGRLLCQDPQGRGYGPVYVQSKWDGSPDAGLRRLDDPLGEAPVAHVALVYSDLQEVVPHPGALAETATRAALSLSHYGSITGAMRLLLADAWANLRAPRDDGQPVGLTPRARVPRAHHLLARMAEALPHPHGAERSEDFGTLIALEDDIASYVMRNDLRERVRGFVEDALIRLAGREDINRLVVNAHSQGTMICFDVLARVPTDTLKGKIAKFITAGSPIRKYIDLLSWGERVGALAPLSDSRGWINFWDAHDPVADPLNPPASWRPGQPLDQLSPEELGLLVSQARDGSQTHFFVQDCRVDNLKNPTFSGLPAHDYWNNKEGFIAPVVKLLRLLVK